MCWSLAWLEPTLLDSKKEELHTWQVQLTQTYFVHSGAAQNSDKWSDALTANKSLLLLKL